MDRGEQKRGSKVVMTGFIQQIPLLYWLYCTEVCNMSSLGKISSAILEYPWNFAEKFLIILAVHEIQQQHGSSTSVEKRVNGGNARQQNSK